MAKQPHPSDSTPPPDREGDADLLQRIDALSTVFDLSEWFAGTSNLDEVLNATAERVSKVMHAKACGIRLWNRETGEMTIKAVYNLSDAYLNKGPVLVTESRIDAAALAGENVYIEDASTDPRVRYPAQAKAEGLVSALCVPMTYRGRTVGVIRVYFDKRRRVTPIEEALLRNAGTQAAAGILEAQMIREQRETDRYLRQMRYAGEIQRRMIPDKPAEHPLVSFGCVYDPSLDVGGDFYDFIDLADGAVGLTVADVVGKGFPGALMMASVRSALRVHATSADDLREIVGRVNWHMCRDTLPNEFATLFYGVFSTGQRRITYVNAGHDPPLLLRGDSFRELDVGGMVIGVVLDSEYEEETIELETGDVLVFYTDGVIDALNFDGEHFGRPRLRESIRKHRDAEAGTLAQQILWDTRRFAGLTQQNDDITVVVAKVG